MIFIILYVTGRNKSSAKSDEAVAQKKILPRQIPSFSRDFIDRIAYGEIASHTIGTPNTLLQRPRHHDFIADILVNLAAETDDRVSDVVKKIIEEIMERHMTELFCDRRRGLQV